MKKETTAPKAPRITKKALIATLMAKGVDAKIVKSLERSNIETIKFVTDLVQYQNKATPPEQSPARGFFMGESSLGADYNINGDACQGVRVRKHK